MTPLRIGAYLHIVAAVLGTGYALFWVVMVRALKSEEPAESNTLLGVVRASRWPPVGPLRLPLPFVGWGILAGLALTGFFLSTLYGDGVAQMLSPDGAWGSAMLVKLAAFAVLVAGQVGITLRPTAALAYLNGFTTLVILYVSVLLRH